MEERLWEGEGRGSQGEAERESENQANVFKTRSWLSYKQMLAVIWLLSRHPRSRTQRSLHSFFHSLFIYFQIDKLSPKSTGTCFFLFAFFLFSSSLSYSLSLFLIAFFLSRSPSLSLSLSLFFCLTPSLFLLLLHLVFRDRVGCVVAFRFSRGPQWSQRASPPLPSTAGTVSVKNPFGNNEETIGKSLLTCFKSCDVSVFIFWCFPFLSLSPCPLVPNCQFSSIKIKNHMGWFLPKWGIMVPSFSPPVPVEKRPKYYIPELLFCWRVPKP